MKEAPTSRRAAQLGRAPLRGALLLGAFLLDPLLSGCADRPGAPTASPAAERVASHLFHGGRILTLDPVRPEVAALAIADGRVLALGDPSEVESYRGADTRDVDLAGTTLLPAFADHHIHLLNVGLSLLYAAEPPVPFVDLAGLASPEAIGEAVAERAARLPAGSWILGKGWSQGAWGEIRLPTHHPLSRAAPTHPIFLARADGHAGWLNRAALARAGITAGTADPPGGSILRMDGGEPSGVLLERANETVLALLPPPDDEEIARAFRLAAEAIAAQGVAEVWDAGFLARPGIVDLGLDLGRYLELLRRTDAEEPLPLTIHLMVPAPSALASAMLAAPPEERRLSPRIDVTHLKLFADGALGSRGAWLSHPYHDDTSTHGVPRMNRQELAGLARAALDAGLDVATHAIGDGALRETLDVYQQLLAERLDLVAGRLRIEHVSYLREEDFSRSAELGVVLSVQPNFVAPDDQGVAMEDSRVGPDNSRRVYAWGRLAGLGARLALGSDYFTAPLPPLATLYCAVTRRNLGGKPDEGWHPGERLSRGEALRLLVRRYPGGGGTPIEGRLAPGAPADLVQLAADPLGVAEEELPGVEIVATWKDGVRVTPPSL